MMQIEEPHDFVGNAIFCDDIRSEVDQKASYIGVYTSSIMLVHSEFPVTIPKFGIAITFAQKRELFVQNIGIRIFLPGDTDEKASVEADSAQLTMPPIEETFPMILIGAQMIFSPLVIGQAGEIKVRVVREGILHRIGTLSVRSSLSGMTPSPTS